jgi:pimeloyl-ACP methyl ester carboxylesterase
MYQQTENAAVTRHFINLGERQVHYRLAGSGPPLLLLHQSPTSSAEMTTDIEYYAHHFTVIGIDHPGYGLSDPLPDEQPDIEQFADVLAELVAALGLTQVLIYGLHTGAIIGFEFARKYPELCAAAVINGLTCIEGDELKDLLARYNQLPEITRYGTHLPWLWARLRDQTLFFPWYRKTQDARMSLPLHNGEYLHPYLVDFLRAKEGGRPGYQAAFSYPSRARMPGLTTPIYLVNFAPDPLTPHPERIGEFPDCVTREIFDDFNELQHKTLEFLRSFEFGDVDLPRQTIGEFEGSFGKDVINTAAGPVFFRYSHPGDEGAVLLLHDAGSSSVALAPLAQQLAVDFEGRRRIISLDLPGHGDSGDLYLPSYSADSIAILIGIVLRELGLESIDVVAVGASTLIALALAQSEGVAVDNLILIDPWFFREKERLSLSASYAPKLMPGDYGQHLLEAWYCARDSELFWPWNETLPANALARAPNIEPDAIQARTLDILKAGMAFPKLVRDLLSADCDTPFTDIQTEALVCARRGNGHEARAAEAAQLTKRATYNVLPAELAEWSAEVVQMLKQRH